MQGSQVKKTATSTKHLMSQYMQHEHNTNNTKQEVPCTVKARSPRHDELCVTPLSQRRTHAHNAHVYL